MALDDRSSGSTIGVFLFTDLEGSTRLWQAFPEAMKTALARHDSLLQEAVEAHGGLVVKTTGDGILAVFGGAREALLACMAAQRRLQEEAWGEVGALRVRMGLHVGEAQQRGGDFFGTTLNRAARLMAAAHGGQVLLSEAAARLAADALPEGSTLKDLGEHRLKDLQRPERIFQLAAEGLPATFPPLATLNRVPNNLPLQPTVFVGRREELSELKQILTGEAVRLLTLVGPGGTGKTRLAVQAGAELSDRFNDGAYFVNLAPIREPQAALAAISRSVGLSETSGRPIMEDLKRQLREKEMLLLLDNFEQVTEAAVDVAELMQSCPWLKLLATSREALHVRGEYLFPVQPLELPQLNGKTPEVETLLGYESVQLFVERAQAVRPGFTLNEENARAVAELCLRLDGLPLAIELAAARARVFTPQALRQRLGKRLSLLQGGARDLPERQQTLRDTIGWSYELLEEGEKRLFALLAVFASCTFEAATAVAGATGALNGAAGEPEEVEAAVVEGIVSLADKSLLRLVEETRNGAGGEPRWRMLETIREYATERLAAEPALEAAARRAHAAYFADFTQQQQARMAGGGREAPMAALAADVENLRIAWRYWVAQVDGSQGHAAWLEKMVDGLWLLYERRGWYQAIADLTRDLLEVLGRGPTSATQAQQEITLQTSLARALLAAKGYTPDVEEAYSRALALSEGWGEIPQLFPVLRGLSSFYMYRGEYDKGAQIGEKIVALAESQDDDSLRIHGYLVLGANNGFLTGFRAGLEMLEKGIALFERARPSVRPFQLGNYPGIVCYTSSGFFLWWLGYPEQAKARMEQGMAAARQLNHPFTLAYALYHTGVFHLWRGDTEMAWARARELCETAEAHGLQIWETLADILQGAVLAERGEAKAGVALIERGLSAYQDLNSPPVFFPMLVGMRAKATAQAGRKAEALEMIDGFVAQVGEQRISRELPDVLLLKGELLLAEAVAGQKDREAAVAVWQTVLERAPAREAKIAALQAATRLCRLELAAGAPGKGCHALQEVYGSFTEGFGERDLREAREVLGEVGNQELG